MKHYNSKLKIPIVILSIFLGLFCFAKISQAATYYVSTSGNDNNPGTKTQPWKTIQKAVNTVKGGDTVNVRGGVYNERVDLSGTTGVEGKSGDAINGYITYQSYSGEKAVLDGSVFSDWGSGFMSGKWVPSESEKAMNYIKISGFEIRNYPEGGVYFENNRKAGPDNSIASHHIIIENNVFKNCKGGQASILFEGGDQDVGGEGYDIIVRGNTVENSGVHGIKFNGDDPTVIDREHIYNSVIENNIVYGSGQTSAGIGIHVSTGNYNIVVRNNKVYDNKRQGIAAHEIWDSTYENNVVYGNGKGPDSENEGIIVWRSKNLLVSGNLIYDNVGFGLTLWEDLLNTGSSPAIVNNVIRNNQGGGLLISTDVIDGKVYNNTIVSNQGQGISITTSGHDIKNNILYQNTNQVTSGNGNVFDYNLYYPDVSFSGKGIHSISADPLFVNVSDYNYHLQSTSPAINFGTTISSITKDYDGNGRPQGSAYDIGAYEFVEISDTTPPAPPSGVAIL